MTDFQTALTLADARDAIQRYKPEYLSASAITLVQTALRNRNLTLVLGAGVSAGMGFPIWDVLVDDLYKAHYSRIDGTIDTAPIVQLRVDGKTTNLSMIRHLENLAQFPSSVRVMLRDRLYRDFKEDGPGNLVEPLCELFLKKDAPAPIRDVITYNFDNAVERRLAKFGHADISPIYSGETYAHSEGRVRIYHPHGFLPHPADDPAGEISTNGVVFSEREYVAHFMDPNHWANVEQLHHYMGRTCLLIGISMSDINMRRLLDYARVHTGMSKRHVSIQKAAGVPLADYYRERDLASLGIHTLWVKEYEDIPGVLARCAS